MFYFIYRWFVWPLLFATFHLLGVFSKKIARGLALRARVNGRRPWIKHLPPSAPTVWFHCASGEFEYAKPVIKLLKETEPSVKVVVTYFSPTYADQIRAFSGVDWVVPLPWDTPRSLNEFLDSYRPFALLIARTDVWPQMAHVAHLRGLKSVLFSATLTKNSGRTKGLGRWATRQTLDQLDEIFAVTDEDVIAFRSLGLQHARVSREGDTRYDQVLARLASPRELKDVRANRPLFVCGSTWSEDEAVLVPALAQLSGEVCGVMVPHEPTPEHIEKLEAQLQAAGVKGVRYSRLDGETLKDGTCLIVDQTGILAELYLRADFAFVGGSFRKTVHSVMEPLAAGCVTFVGPLHTNNREAVAFSKMPLSGGLSMVTAVRSSEELIQAIRRKPEGRDAILDQVRARTGSSEKLVQWIKDRL